MPHCVVEKCTTLILLIAAYVLFLKSQPHKQIDHIGSLLWQNTSIINAAGQHIASEIIKPRNDHPKDLLVILVTPKAKFKTSDIDFDDKSSDYSEDSSQEVTENLTPKEDEAYFLYHILRTTENSQHIDNKMANTIMRTKEILQPMLRSRCKKLDKCKKKCPGRNNTCEKKCIIMIDILIVCETEPKNKCENKCGKTVPPGWS